MPEENAEQTTEATPDQLAFSSDQILLDSFNKSVSVLPTPVNDNSEVTVPVKETTPVVTEPKPDEGTLSDSDKVVSQEAVVPKPDAPATVEGQTVEGEVQTSDEDVEKKEDVKLEELDVQSFDLPSSDGVEKTTTAVESETLEEGVAFDPTSPLKESDPMWMHESYQRLKGDTELSDEDREVITELPPSSWDSARQWNKSHKSLGQFRNPDYPLPQFIEVLEKQSPERAQNLQLEIVSRLVGDGDKLLSFAESHPDAYGSLMVAMANSQPEFVAKLLQKKGYTVSEFTPPPPINVEEITKLINESEEWSVLEGTELEAKIQELITTSALLSEQVGTPKQVSLDDVVKSDGEKEAETSPDVEALKAQGQLTADVFTGWEKDVRAGVESTGLKPPSDTDMKTKPIPSLLRRLAYNISVHGIEGMIPNWQVALFDWGEKNVKGFTSKTDELTDLIREQREDARGFARSLAPHGHQFGRLRANVPAIQALLKLAEAEEARSSQAPPVTETTVTERAGDGQPNLGGQQPVKTGFAIDRILLGQQ